MPIVIRVAEWARKIGWGYRDANLGKSKPSRFLKNKNGWKRTLTTHLDVVIIAGYT